MTHRQGVDPETDIYERGVVSSDTLPNLQMLATTRLPIHNGYSLALVAVDGSSLNERAVHIGEVQAAHTIADYYQEYDMRYCVRAALYHLNRIVDLYVGVCRLFEGSHPTVATRSGSNTDDSRIYFEIDAFLSAARRAYDAISNVIWKHFVGGSGRWDSAHGAIEWIEKHPGGLAPEIAEQFRGKLGTVWRKAARLPGLRDAPHPAQP